MLAGYIYNNSFPMWTALSSLIVAYTVQAHLQATVKRTLYSL